MRSDAPGGTEITRGRTNIVFPEGTYKHSNLLNIITASWYFNPPPKSFDGSDLKTKVEPIVRKCVIFEPPEGTGATHRGKLVTSEEANKDGEAVLGYCNPDLPTAHQTKKHAVGAGNAQASGLEVTERLCDIINPDHGHNLSKVEPDRKPKREFILADGTGVVTAEREPAHCGSNAPNESQRSGNQPQAREVLKDGTEVVMGTCDNEPNRCN